MITLLTLLLSLAFRIVLAKEELRLMLYGGLNPCEGYIRLFYEGKWGVVGSDHWTAANEEVACRSIQCGASQGSRDEYLREDLLKTVWLNQLQCKGDEDQLWKCPGTPGLGVSTYTKDTVKFITCAENVSLKLDGFRCAGAVYTQRLDNSSSYFCSDWDRGDHWANDVCNRLECGEDARPGVMLATTDFPGFSNSNKVSTRCTATKEETHPLQCDPKTSNCANPAVVICTDHVVWRLDDGSNPCSGKAVHRGDTVNCSDKGNLKSMCENMRCGEYVSKQCVENNLWLNCSANIRVLLKQPGTVAEADRRFGVVHVAGPLGVLPVCASNWTDQNSKVVCAELGFGKVVETTRQTRVKTEGVLDHVSCLGNERSLWHCKAKYSGQPLKCDSIVSVTCGACVKVQLSDGPGRCAGRVELKIANSWHRVGSKWTEANSHVFCNELNCGMALPGETLDKLSEGNLPFTNKKFDCQGAKKMSDCTVEKFDLRSETQRPTTLVCEDHLEVFVQGSSWCEGAVVIRKQKDHFWLSGSAATWNQEAADVVCRQMHCGSARSFSSLPLNASTVPDRFKNQDSGVREVWPWNYSCSSKEESLFDCQSSNQEDNSTTATVTCAGSVTLELTSHCAGAVKVCVNGTCGGVCKESWSKAKSQALCLMQDCGEPVSVPDLRNTQGLPVTVKSLHLRPRSGNSLVLNLPVNTGYCKGKPAVVACSGSYKARMAVSRDHCFGELETVSGDLSFPICLEALSKSVKAQDAICAELNCGKSNSSVVDMLPRREEHSVVKLDCKDSKSLKNCTHTFVETKCARGRLKCSDWRQMVLSSTVGACEGVVSVYHEEGAMHVSGQGWTQAEGQVLCRDLGCGDYQTHKAKEPHGLAATWGTFNCSGVDRPRNIWDCMRSKNASASKPIKRLYIKCTGHINVSLTGACKGRVSLNNQFVSASAWKMKDSHRVCQEKDCGDALDYKVGGLEYSQGVEVSCMGAEECLGQCLTSRWDLSQNVTVFCRNAVEFKTTEKCGGKIEVLSQLDNKWEMICLKGSLSDNMKIDLCKKLKCKPPIRKSLEEKAQMNLEFNLACTDNHKDIRYCVEKKRCRSRPAEIYCGGYTPPKTAGFDKSLLVGLITGLVLLVLVVGLLFLLRRVYLRNRVPKHRGVDVDTSDYEDIGKSPNGKGSRGRMGSRSPPAGALEDDASLASSYDDVAGDAPGETLPLTREEDPEDNPKTSYSDVASSSKAADVVRDEAEIQEDYDDVDVMEAGGQVAETSAEVNSGQQAASHRELPQVPEDDIVGSAFLEPDPLG